MSIPLDRLYHYIESVAQDVYGDTIIYRFYPHGSKKIEDLTQLRTYPDQPPYRDVNPQIICHDQEPLNYTYYQNVNLNQAFPELYPIEFVKNLEEVNLYWGNYNIRCVPGGPPNIYDQCILLHSELRSKNATVYQNNGFIPVYYWNHALLALDWFRYAQHQQFFKNQSCKTFLIYNRAWAGSREYRLKFAELLVKNQLTNYCQTSVGFVDHDIHYKDYTFTNTTWQPDCDLEQHFINNVSTSCSSADFNADDYNSTDIEVVLETLFDDQRLHLTEKTLRPIACGQPFILCATHGSLEYIRSYGFQTFDQVFDETYDTIVDPLERMQAIIEVMKEITNWSETEQVKKLKQLNQIAEYNRQHFFSSKFIEQITSELHTNLKEGLNLLETTNTSQRFINQRKLLATHPNIKSIMMANRLTRTRADTAYIVAQARKYYNKYLAKSK